MSLGDTGLALLRFTQVCCRDICLFQPLPWFAAASSLQNMGSKPELASWIFWRNSEEEDSVEGQRLVL